MGIIERSIRISGINSKKRVLAFFDSGSSFSIINSSLATEIKPLRVEKTNIEVELGNGNKIRFTKAAHFIIYLNNQYYPMIFLVGDIPEQIVIGVDFLQKYKHIFDFSNDTINAKNLHLKNRRGKYVL